LNGGWDQKVEPVAQAAELIDLSIFHADPFQFGAGIR